jgi:hypothetical protein
LTKYHKKFGFIENVVFCKCQNLKEDIFFWRSWTVKFLEIKYEGLSSKGCHDLNKKFTIVKRNLN